MRNVRRWGTVTLVFTALVVAGVVVYVSRSGVECGEVRFDTQNGREAVNDQRIKTPARRQRRADAVIVPVVAGRVEGTARWDLAAGQGILRSETRHVWIAVTFGACTGAPGKPRVRRTGGSVVITVPLPPGEPRPPGGACPDIAYLQTVGVRLGGALGCRALRDGSRTPSRFVDRVRR